MELLSRDAFAEQETEDAETLHLRGSIHLQNRRYSLAVSDLLRAVEKAPFSAKSYNNLGAAYANLGMLDEAADCFGRAVGIDAEPLYLNNLAFVHMLLGHTEESNLYRAMAGDQVTASCPYLPDRYIRFTECLRVEGMDVADFDKHLEKGFRRIGQLLERNVCAGCADCVQIRIPVAEFRPDRAQRRNLALNSDIDVEFLEKPFPTPEKEAIYSRYMRERHFHPAERIFEQEFLFLYTGWHESREAVYRREGKIVAVGMIDEGRKGAYLSAFFYDLSFLARGPGVFHIQTAIRLEAERGRSWLYFGETIEKKGNMRYKKSFRPHELLDGNTWVRSGSTEADNR
jgi:arginine-tRNA-protein transferase